MERYERISWLNEDERRRLYAVIQSTPKGKRDRAVVVLMMNHSLSVSEVCGLETSDVDLAAGKHGAVRVLSRGRERTIYLTVKTRATLVEWLETRGLLRLDAGALFVSMHSSQNRCSQRQPGDGITPRGVRKEIDRYMNLAGIKAPGRSCHALRHTFFAESLRRGADLAATSKAGGHASVAAMMVYVDLAKMAKENPAELLDDMISDEVPALTLEGRARKSKTRYGANQGSND